MKPLSSHLTTEFPECIQIYLYRINFEKASASYFHILISETVLSQST